MTVCKVISLLKYHMYTVYTYKCMVLANSMNSVGVGMSGGKAWMVG